MSWHCRWNCLDDSECLKWMGSFIIVLNVLILYPKLQKFNNRALNTLLNWWLVWASYLKIRWTICPTSLRKLWWTVDETGRGVEEATAGERRPLCACRLMDSTKLPSSAPSSRLSNCFSWAHSRGSRMYNRAWDSKSDKDCSRTKVNRLRWFGCWSGFDSILKVWEATAFRVPKLREGEASRWSKDGVLKLGLKCRSHLATSILTNKIKNNQFFLDVDFLFV